MEPSVSSTFPTITSSALKLYDLQATELLILSPFLISFSSQRKVEEI